METTQTRPRLAQASGHELEALLAPVTPESFVRDYWGRKPLFVKGFKEKYEGFFDGAAFSRALSLQGPTPPDFLRASFDRKTSDGSSLAPHAEHQSTSTAFRATPDQAVALFDAGATLCVSQIETRVPSLAQFVSAIKRQLRYPCRVSFNAYLSPAGSGYNWHFDSRVATTLQIEGTKRWRFSKAPAIPWPRANGSVRGDGKAYYADPSVSVQDWEQLTPFDPSDVSEALLEPGDLLILPAGVWHEACGGGSGSLALNLAFTPVAYTMIVAKILDAVLTPEAEWRSPAPLLPDDSKAVEEISAQLTRAASLLQSLAADEAEIVRVWESLAAN